MGEATYHPVVCSTTIIVSFAVCLLICSQTALDSKRCVGFSFVMWIVPSFLWGTKKGERRVERKGYILAIWKVSSPSHCFTRRLSTIYHILDSGDGGRWEKLFDTGMAVNGKGKLENIPLFRHTFDERCRTVRRWASASAWALWTTWESRIAPPVQSASASWFVIHIRDCPIHYKWHRPIVPIDIRRPLSLLMGFVGFGVDKRPG